MARIAVCAPATPISRETSRRVSELAAAEFPQHRLTFHPQCFAERGHFAGSDDLRMDALVECANDPSIDAVWFAKGGYGSNRIAAEAVARMGLAARTKRFVGYSDSGYLLAALYRERVGRPVHAPMPGDIRREGGGAAVRRTLAFLDDDASGLEPSLDDRPTVAFNLITLAMLLGTELVPDLSGHVVMIEEVSEHLYAVDRLFFHITQQLRGIAGLRLGRIGDVPENDRPFGFDAEEIARHWCNRAGVPFLGAADIGHDIYNKIVPFGLVHAPARS